MPVGICRLCLKETELKLSHFIPKFVGKWVKDTSATGYIRLNSNVNKRAQDIEKDYWLCGECEQLFSVWEREFANQIFYPFMNESKSEARYGDWLAKFCASLSWRTLTYMRHQNSGSHDSRMAEMDSAQAGLADFLLGKTSSLGKFEQHLFPVEAIDSTNATGLPHTINRYFLRTMHMDLLASQKNFMIYTKLPGFILLGLVGSDEASTMRSSRVSIGGSKISPRKYFWPTGFAEYLFTKAAKITEMNAQINERQQEVIDKTVKKDLDRVASSKTFEAFAHDQRMFGKKVFD